MSCLNKSNRNNFIIRCFNNATIILLFSKYVFLRKLYFKFLLFFFTSEKILFVNKKVECNSPKEFQKLKFTDSLLFQDFTFYPFKISEASCKYSAYLF